MTMQFIASGVATAGSEITFSSIPQTFTHLQIRIFGRSSYTSNYGWTGLYFNASPVAGNYPAHTLTGDGSSASSSAQTGFNQIIPDLFALPSPYNSTNSAIFGSVIWDILDYTNTNKNKTVRCIQGWDGNGVGRACLSSGAWISTSAITQIQVSCIGGFVAGSRADLYGITTSELTGA